MSDTPAPTSELSRLILDRMADLGLTYGEVAKRAQAKGHDISRASVYAIANSYKRHHTPYSKTLKALAAGLDYPFDVIATAAAQSAGYSLQEVTVPLRSAGGLRVIAAAYEELDADQQADLARLAERYAAQAREARALRATGGD